MAIATLTVDLNARIAHFETELKRATGTLDRFGKTSSAISTGFKAAFAGVGVAGLAAFAKSSINAADALNDLSDRVGVSVKDLASFKLAAQLADTSLEGVGKGIARLTRSIGEAEGGNKKLAETLNTLGITARDPKEAFFQLADAVQKTEDPSKRAALLSQVLGKSYQELIPLLNQGSEGLRESAKQSESFSDAMARLAPDAAKFNDSLDKLKTNSAGFAATILGPVVQAMNRISAEFSEGIRLAGGFGKALVLFGSINPFKSTGDNLEALGKRFVVIDQQINRAKESGNKRTLENLQSERSDVIKKIQYLTAIKKAGEPVQEKKKFTPGDVDLPTEKASKSKGAKVIDPLASLLSQTDTAKFAEYTKLQDLLNARFEKGAVNGKQYAEALTVLRKGYYTDELKAYAEQLEYNLETERLVADHLKETEDALRDNKNAWAEAGQALEDEMRTPLERLNLELERYKELLDRGDISLETYTRGVAKVRDEIKSWGDDTSDVTDMFKASFQDMGNALSSFVTTGKLDFKSLVRTMLEGFAKIAFQKAILNIAGSLFGGSFGAGAAAKVAGGSLGTTAYSQQSVMLAQQVFAKGGIQSGPGISAYSGSIVSKPTVFPFAKGIGLMGEAGAEAILPLKRGKDGKLGVGTSGGGGNVNVSIAIDASGTKAQGDEGKAGQLAREFEGAVLGVITKHQRPGGILA